VAKQMNMNPIPSIPLFFSSSFLPFPFVLFNFEEISMDTRSHKEQVYDRQLRLWGVKGQEYLEQSHVGVLGSSVSECEVLKNLVLPGIGTFTIIDNALVEERDIGKNFFLQEESVGRPRAEETCAFLCEMNPYVSGNAVVRDPAEIIQDTDFLSQFTLVVVSNSLTFTQVMELDESLRRLDIPMVMVRSLGFFGFVRVSHPLHTSTFLHAHSRTPFGDKSRLGECCRVD
jgi:NEDD8-activating enzyme E1 regulatory subunit